MSAVARAIEAETGTTCATVPADLTQADAAKAALLAVTADGGWTKASA